MLNLLIVSVIIADLSAISSSSAARTKGRSVIRCDLLFQALASRWSTFRPPWTQGSRSYWRLAFSERGWAAYNTYKSFLLSRPGQRYSFFHRCVALRTFTRSEGKNKLERYTTKYKMVLCDVEQFARRHSLNRLSVIRASVLSTRYTRRRLIDF